MNEEKREKLQTLLEEHFPANGFRRLGQYRRASDAITRAMLRDPGLLNLNLLKLVQLSLANGANMLLEELTAKKEGVPVEVTDETETERKPDGPLIEGKVINSGDVVPYRKTG